MKIIKNLILYLLLLLFIQANTSETLTYFLKAKATLTQFDLGDFDEKEKSNENEKPDEKSEKIKHFFDQEIKISLNSETLFSYNLTIPFIINFSSSDFSQVIYSPPELA